MPRRGSQSLTPEESARVRAALETMIQRAGTQRELARRLGVTGQAISRVMVGHGAGVTLARKVAEAMGVPVDVLLSGGKVERADTRLGGMRGWDQAEAEARRRNSWIPERAWEAVRELRTMHPPKTITPEWVAAVASDWARVMDES